MIARVFQSLVFSFILFLSLLINQRIQSDIGFQPQKNLSAQHTQNTTTVDASHNSMTYFGQMIKNFTDLSYSNTQELTLTLPETKHCITFNWKFGGSGNIFLPLPSVTAQYLKKTDSEESPTPEKSAAQNMLAELGKAFLKNELNKKSKHVTLLKWLTQTKLSPLHLFVIKVLLLFKDTHPINDASFIKSELCRLLFRLSLVEDIHLFDTKKPLSAHLPEVLTEGLALVAPDTLFYLDNVWRIMKTSSLSTENQDTYLSSTYFQIKAYAFYAQNKAEQCYTSWQKSNFTNDIHSIIFKNGLELVPSYHEFTTIHPSSKNNLASFLVSELSLAGDIKDEYVTSLFPTLPIIFKENADKRTFLLEGNEGQWWIVQLSENFELRETLELIMYTFTQAFKEIIKKQQDYFLTHPQEAQKYQQTLQITQAEQEKKLAFLNTPSGKASIQRIAQNLELLEQKYTAHCHTQYLKEIDNSITLLTKEIKDLQKKQTEHVQKLITQKEQELTTLKSKKQQVMHHSTTSLAEKRKQLEQLIFVIAQKQMRGEKSGQEFEDLRTLQTEIESVEKNTTTTQQLYEKEKKQKEQAAIYEKEATLLMKEWQKKVRYIPTPDQAVQFFTLQDGLKLYIQELQEKTINIASTHDQRGTGLIQQLIANNPELQVLNLDEINKKLITTLTHIFHHSTHIQENVIIYETLIKSFFPESLGWFEKLVLN